MRKERLWLMFAPLLALGSLPAQQFVEAPLATVREQARGARPAVIDFSNDACEPCRRLLATTWKDKALWQWLTKNAIVSRVDPEKDRAAAQEFQIVAYPTIVVLDKDGAEAGRIVGYLSAEALRQKLDEILQPLPTNHGERLSLAHECARDGKLEEALAHYVWLWEYGLEHNRGFGGRRLTIFLRDFFRFARKHPPARDVLVAFRDRAEKRAIGGDLELQNIQEIVSLNERLKQPERSLAVLEMVPADQWSRHEVAKGVLAEAAFDVLLGKRRYVEAVKLIEDPAAAFEQEIRRYAEVPLPDEARSQMQRLTFARQKGVLEALFGAKSNDEAAALFDRLLEFDDSADTWVMAIRAAKRADNDVVMHDYSVRALSKLPEEQHARIRSLLRKK